MDQVHEDRYNTALYWNAGFPEHSALQTYYRSFHSVDDNLTSKHAMKGVLDMKAYYE